MGAVLAFTHHLETITCGKCGIEFAVPDHLDDHATFWCPNGHARGFVGETEAQRLAKELETQKRATEFQREQRLLAERSLVAQKAQTTKARNQLARTANGICPCCNRTFQNVMRHMATKHPDFKKPGES